MMAVNLQKMSRKELEKLRADIDKELAAAEDRDRKEALKAAKEAAAKFGYSLEDLSGEGGRRRKAAKSGRARADAKYRNPANPDQTWSGLGRKPQWFHDEMAKGTELSSLEI